MHTTGTMPPFNTILNKCLPRNPVAVVGHRQRPAIQRDDEVMDSPDATTTLREGDTLIGVGTPENCEAFEEILTG